MKNISSEPFTPPHQLKTAVLFLIFNRLDTTMQVFEAIRLARPPRLYIAADGPRDSRPDEDNKVKAVRNYVMDHIDWGCEVKTLFREKNLGCKYGVSGGIDWFFENEEMGIILEDDCLPSQSFFWFCEEMLQWFRYDARVMQICGSNFLNGWRRHKDSYYFSMYGPIWGWASWSRAWKYYDVDIKLWPEVKEKKIYLDFCDGKQDISFRLNLYDKIYSGQIDTWDYQWGFAKLINSGLSVTPNVNMISNIGFGKTGTHVTDGNTPYANMKALNLFAPYSHPNVVLRDRISDQRFLKNFVYTGLFKRFINQLQRITKKIENEN
jgi:hypothetical protein